MEKRATIHDAAQAYSWALRFAIVDLPHVVSWADFQIDRNLDNPFWIIELSLTRDRNTALTSLNEAVEGHEFGTSFGLLAALAADAIRKTAGQCNPILSSLVTVLRDQHEWMNRPEHSDAWNLYAIEEELEEGFASEKDARAAIAKYAEPYEAVAINIGMIQPG